MNKRSRLGNKIVNNVILLKNPLSTKIQDEENY